MRVGILLMMDRGREIPRSNLSDRFQVMHRGELEILETDDQGRRRRLTVARLSYGGAGAPSDARRELLDPKLIWLSGNRFVLRGFERHRDGQAVTEYAQAWLCSMMQVDAAEDGRERRPPPLR